MLLQLVMLAALGAACAGCSARPAGIALTAGNPANPDAAAVPFVRPANVLAEGAASADGHRQVGRLQPVPGSSDGQDGRPGADHGAMPGMTMPGDAQ